MLENAETPIKFKTKRKIDSNTQELVIFIIMYRMYQEWKHTIYLLTYRTLRNAEHVRQLKFGPLSHNHAYFYVSGV